MPIRGDIYAPLVTRQRNEGFATLGDFFQQFEQQRANREARKDREEARAIQRQDRELRQQEIDLRNQTIAAQTRKLQTDEEAIAATRQLIAENTAPDGTIDKKRVVAGVFALDPKRGMELQEHWDKEDKAQRDAETGRLANEKTKIETEKMYREMSQKPTRPGSLLPVVGPDGTTIYATPEDAIGKQRPESSTSAGSDYARFESDFLEAEATRLGKTVAQLTPPERVTFKTAARKAFGQADDAARSSGGMTPYAESNIMNRLVTQWLAASKPAVELDRQVQIMDAGIEAARKGNLAQGAQAVLVTFQKILDPTSVVRESEYARSGQGQALMTRIEGAMEQLAKGGAGVPLSELERFASLAREMSKAQGQYRTAIKDRIGKNADRYGIPRDLVFEDFALPGAVAPPTAGPAAAPKNPFRP